MTTMTPSGGDAEWAPLGAIAVEVVSDIRRVFTALLHRMTSPYDSYQDPGQLTPQPADPDMRLLAAGVVIAILLAAVSLFVVVRRTRGTVRLAEDHDAGFSHPPTPALHPVTAEVVGGELTGGPGQWP